MRLLFLTLFILLIYPTDVVYAQLNNNRFYEFTFEEGLRDFAITSLHQDKEGFIWIGTQGALYKYDGKSFDRFTPIADNPNSLSHEFIYAIEEDNEGNLWIGTRGGGFTKFDRSERHFYQFKNDSTNANSLSNNYVRTIYPDDNGTIWVGAKEGVLNEFNPKTGIFTRHVLPYPGNPTGQASDIFDILESTSYPNLLWITSQEGFYSFDKATKKATLIESTGTMDAGEGQRIMYSLYEDRSGHVWIGTNKGGLLMFDSHTTSFVPQTVLKPADARYLSNHFISKIVEDREGYIWIGTFTGGLSRLDPAHGELELYQQNPDDPSSLSHNEVTALLQDANGLFWVGTYFGLNTYNPLSKKIKLFSKKEGHPSSLTDSEVLSLAENASGDIWIGTMDGGLNKLDPKNSTVFHFTHLPDSLFRRINVVYVDHIDQLWVAANDNFLYRMDRESNDLTPILLDNSTAFSNIQTIYESPLLEGILWIGTSNSGMYKYDLSNNKITNYSSIPDDDYSLSNNYVTRFHHDQSGIFWIATRGGGLNQFDPDTESFTHIKNEPGDSTSLSSNIVISIAEDSNGNMWFGTTNQGINKYNRATEQFERYSESSGFPFFDTGSILEDQEGYLWLGTSTGIIRFNPSTKSFIRLGPKDGLQGYLFRDLAHLKTGDGTFYFGGINGLNSFNPEDLWFSPPPSNITLTKLTINDVNTPLSSELISGEVLKLKYHQNFLRFDFSVMDFADPNLNHYSYFLEGQDMDWVLSGDNSFARYPKLEPDKYTFWIKGRNHLGIDSKEKAALHIEISPPWWETVWFRTLTLLSIVAFGMSLYRFRVKQLIETERVRMRIARDLHDTVQGDLSAIALLSDMIRQDSSLKLPDEKRIKKISETARISVQELRDIIWFIKPSESRNGSNARSDADDIKELIDKLESTAEDRLIGIRYELICGDSLSGTQLDMNAKRHLLPGFKEILQNIIKHAQASHVKIHIDRLENLLVLQVTDNGVGFDKSTIKHGNGLDNLKVRATSMNGGMDYFSRPGEGTTIKLWVKIKEKQGVLAYLNYYTSYKRLLSLKRFFKKLTSRAG